jgi:two-component system nitrate/nitrite response regulator NarL
LQALDLGIRGILRKNLPIEAHRQCQYTVAEGQFWLEKSLIARLLSDRKVALTPRGSQLATMLARGLKNKEQSRELGLTEGSIKVYLSQ